MKRLTVFCLLALGLMGVCAGIFHGATRQEPRIQAAMRDVPVFAAEALWRYTGPRPREGETLVAYGRQVNRYDMTRIELVAYTADTLTSPAQWNLWVRQPLMVPHGFVFGRMHIPLWPDNTELLIGIRREHDKRVFWEQGPWPSAPLEARAWTRPNPHTPFHQRDKEEFSSLDVRILPTTALFSDAGSSSTPAIIHPPPSPGPAFWGGLIAWGVLVLVGWAGLPGRRMLWLAWNCLLVLLLWKIITAVWMTQYTWSGYYLERIGRRGFWMGLVAIAVLAFPPFLGLWRRGASCVWIPILRFARRHRRVSAWFPRLVAIAAAILLTSLFWNYPCRAAYGDGFSALSGPFGDRHNPLSSALYSILKVHHAKLQAPLDNLLGAWAPNLGKWDLEHMRWFLLPFGFLYVIAAAGIARELGRGLRERTLVWALLLTLHCMVLQFQYIEVYGPALAVVALTVWLLLRTFLRDRGLVLSSGGAYAGYLFYFGSAPLVPFVGALWLREAVRRRFRPSALLPRLFWLGLLVIVLTQNTVLLIFLVKYKGDYNRFHEYMAITGYGLKWFLGPVHGSWEDCTLNWSRMHYTHDYTLWTLRHLSQWGSAMLFTAGPAVFLGVLAFLAGIVRWTRSWLGWAAVTAMLLALAATFPVFINYGLPRDWDVFCAPAFVCVISFLILLIRCRALPREAASWCLAAMLLYQFWDTSLWVYYNIAWGPPIVQRQLLGF